MKQCMLLAVVVFFGTAAGCSGGASSGGMKPAGSSQAQASQSSSESNKNAPNTVTVSPEEQRVAGIAVASVELRSVPRTLAVPGQIVVDEDHTAHIAPYFEGKVIDVLKLPGDFVHSGEVLAHLHSHSLHETVGALAQDYANLARQQSAVLYAQQMRDRYDHLYAIQAASLEQQQTSTQNLVQAQTALVDAQAAVTMEREHLADLLQIPPATITPATLYTYENLPIKTPITGTVMTRSITPGAVLEPGSEAYTVSNLGEVWMVAAVNQADMAQLRVAEHANVRTDAWPHQNFPGVVTLIGGTLDPTTRTVQVRITLPNPRGELKPLMFTTATINEGDEPSLPALFVPEDALQQVNGVQVAFVTKDQIHFTPRALRVLPAVNGQVQVLEGLQPGDRIAITGAFMLKSALLKSTLGSD